LRKAWVITGRFDEAIERNAEAGKLDGLAEAALADDAPGRARERQSES
jgi:hypothetical protein